MADSDNSAQRVALYVVNPREAVSEALDRVAAALPGATVGRPDDVGIVEVALDAPSFDAALTRVWDAIAAAGADDAAPKPGFYLQLGAYAREGKAEEVSEKIKQSGVDLAIQVVHSGSVNRVYGGPFDTRALAQEAARALPSGLGLKPIIVRR